MVVVSNVREWRREFEWRLRQTSVKYVMITVNKDGIFRTVNTSDRLNFLSTTVDSKSAIFAR